MAVDLPGGKERRNPGQEGGDQKEDSRVCSLPAAQGRLSPPPETQTQIVKLLPDESGRRGKGQRPADHTLPPVCKPSGGVANLGPEQGWRWYEPPSEDGAHDCTDDAAHNRRPEG